MTTPPTGAQSGELPSRQVRCPCCNELPSEVTQTPITWTDRSGQTQIHQVCPHCYSAFKMAKDGGSRFLFSDLAQCRRDKPTLA